MPASAAAAFWATIEFAVVATAKLITFGRIYAP
jgi:hypothetical protein